MLLRATALALALTGGAAHAQDSQQPQIQPPQILTLDQDKLFLQSAFGKAAAAKSDAAEAALLAENKKIFAGLEAEEKTLTERRASTDAAEFTGLAQAFDAKAEKIRAEQDAKGLEIARQRQEDQRRFFAVAYPELGKLMTELGAVAVLDKKSVIISYDVVDMTDRAIARIDAVLGDGTKPAPASP